MCGVFGVWAPGEDVAKLTYFGLYALQHRGQESAGIATADGDSILVYKDLGLVSQVFSESALDSLKGHLAIGHARYSTTGGVTWENAQPTLGDTAYGPLALAHNGNLINSHELRDLIKQRYGSLVDSEVSRGNTTDTALITALLTGNTLPRTASSEGAQSTEHNLFETAMEVLPHLKGAFSLVFMDEKSIYAARDPQGLRPMVIGRVDTGYVVASENAALDICGASFVREVDPGELIRIDEDGIHSERFTPERRAGCVFEYVYLARPDATIFGRSVHESRVEMGRILAREAPVEADIVIPVPESGTPAATGYAAESGIPFAQGLIKNTYVGRTFIQPSDTLRRLGIRLKLNPLKHVIEGKSVCVVDDSIVRGNTQRQLVKILKEYGAREVHIRISSPPVKYPCYYGIDFASRAELIANGMTNEEMSNSFGADSLAFISLEGMISACNRPVDSMCQACFTGNYPIELPEEQKLGKFLFETGQLNLPKKEAVDGSEH